MKLSLFSLSFYLFVSTAVAGIVPRDPAQYGQYGDCKSTVTKVSTETLTKVKVMKTIVNVYPKPTTLTKTITKTVGYPAAKVTVTTTKRPQTVTVTKTVGHKGDYGYPVPCYPSTVTNTVTIPTTIKVAGTCYPTTVVNTDVLTVPEKCYPTTVTDTTTLTIPGEGSVVTVTGECVPTTAAGETVTVPGECDAATTVTDITTLTVPTTIAGEPVTVTESTTLTIPGEGQVVTVTEPTTYTVTDSTTVTEPTTVTEATTVTEPTTYTVTDSTTVTESTTITEPTTVTESTTVTEPTTVLQPTTEFQTETVTVTSDVPTTVIETVTVTAPAQTCNPQPILNPGFEQSNPEIWYFIGGSTSAQTGIQADASAHQGSQDFFGRGTSASTAWDVTLGQPNVFVCPGSTYVFTAWHKQFADNNCHIQWYIDDVEIASGVPGKVWGAISTQWSPAPGQSTIEVKMKASCGKGGNPGRMWVDDVTLALQAN